MEFVHAGDKSIFLMHDIKKDCLLRRSNCHYIDLINFDQTFTESAMSINKFMAWITSPLTDKKGESMSYDAIFKGTCPPPSLCAGHTSSFLPGLRAVDDDVDAFFKEVFAGPVF